MMNRLRNNESPITTWFGGMLWTPSALRTSENTMTMRVKLVNMMTSDGATDSSVKPMMRMIDSLGGPSPSSAPRSTLKLTTPVSPSSPITSAMSSGTSIVGVSTGSGTVGSSISCAPAGAEELTSARKNTAPSKRRRRGSVCTSGCGRSDRRASTGSGATHGPFP